MKKKEREVAARPSLDAFEELIFEPSDPAPLWTDKAEMIMEKNYERFAEARRVGQLVEIINRETGQKLTMEAVVGKAKRMGLQKTRK